MNPKKQFIGKKDSNFTIQECRDILDYMVKKYFPDNKEIELTFEEIVIRVADDLGLSTQQIRDAFSHPEIKEIVTDLEFVQNQLVNSEKNLLNQLKKPFAYKTDLIFTPQESLEIAQYVQKEYFPKKENRKRKFNDIIQDIANDLGLTNKQVRTAIYNIDKDIIKELERTHNKLLKANNKTIQYIKTANYPKIIRLFKLTSVWTWIMNQKRV